MLAEVARRLAHAAAGGGVVARLAADSFAILLLDVATGSAGCAAIERILRELDHPLDSRNLRVSASCGLARVSPDLRSPEALLPAADAALDVAQSDAPGHCVLFAPVMHAQRLEDATLRADLAVGIRAGELELDYQPVVDAETGLWCSAEALVRWRHPDLGRLAPDRFIPLAEQSELIVMLGEMGARRGVPASCGLER